MLPASDRRRFLQSSLVSGIGLAAATRGPQGWLQAAAQAATKQDRILVVIQLSGGNDGLNTVVPYADENYRRARPKLSIPADTVIKLDDAIGLHPSLSSLESILSDERFTIIQGVGYERPNRSHFESMDIWHTCQRKEDRTSQGWLGRWLSNTRTENDTGNEGETAALHLGQESQPLALASRDIFVPSVASVAQFRLQLSDSQALKEEVFRLTQQATLPSDADDQPALLDFLEDSTRTALESSRKLEAAATLNEASSEFPSSQLGQKLRIISQLIDSGLSTRIYYVTLDGFDTHAQQPLAHAALLRQWAEAQSALLEVLKQRGHADRVLVMTFSEFGRRVAENASGGTDHGAAAPVFLAGPSMKTNLIGALPSLTDLDDGDLKFHTDFRRVYATVIDRWFAGESGPIVGPTFQPLDPFA